jgi:hypothetical protein
LLLALVVDDHTDYCWSLFLKAKSDLKGKILILLTDLEILAWMSNLFNVMNRGESKALFDECRSKGTM